MAACNGCTAVPLLQDLIEPGQDLIEPVTTISPCILSIKLETFHQESAQQNCV